WRFLKSFAQGRDDRAERGSQKGRRVIVVKRSRRHQLELDRRDFRYHAIAHREHCEGAFGADCYRAVLDKAGLRFERELERVVKRNGAPRGAPWSGLAQTVESVDWWSSIHRLPVALRAPRIL